MLYQILCSVLSVLLFVISGFSMIMATLLFDQVALAATSRAELRIIAAEIPYGLDPVHEFTAYALRSVGAAEGLLRLTPEGKVVPELAESIRALDPLTWEIKLRPNVHFWSGALVDAKAVKASLERASRLAPGAELLLQGVRIRVVDDLTLQFSTEQPYPSLPLNLADQWLVIHNAASYGEQKNAFDLSAMDLTGMFRVTTFKPKQEMLLEAWKGYWGEKPQIGRIHYIEVSDSQARVLAAQSGSAHIVRNITPTGAVILQHNPELNIISVPSAGTVSVYLNLRFSPFADVRVRQALSWSIDRQELVNLSREGLSQPLPSWLASNPAYPEAMETGYTRYDPLLAARLLDEAGWRMDHDGIRRNNGQPLAFRLLSWGIEKPVSEVLQHQWQKVGIQVHVFHSDDYGLIQNSRDRGDWEALIEAWGTFGDPIVLLSEHFSPEGAINYGGYNDPVFNALLKRLHQTTEEEKRRQLVLQANQRVSEMAPILPLHPRPQLTAIRKNVEGYVIHFRQYEYQITAKTTLRE